MSRPSHPSLVVVVLLVLALGQFPALAESDTSTSVLVLDRSNFDATVSKFPFLLVKFYAPWCGHCKALAPEYKKAAEILKYEDPPVMLAKVDATVEESLASRFKVRGFPTLKLFKHGKEYEYAGGRTSNTIIPWVKKRTGASTKRLTTEKEVADFLASAAGEVKGIAFLSDDSPAKKPVEEVASNFDDIEFAVAPEALASDHSPDGLPGIILFRSFDSGNIMFEGPMDGPELATSLTTWIDAKRFPLIVKFTTDTAAKIFGGDTKVHILVFYEEGDEKLEAAMKESAQRHENELLFVSVAPDQERIYEFFDITKADLPQVRLVNMGDGSTAMRKYTFRGDVFSSNDYDNFIAAFKRGEIAPVLKSQKVPEKNDGPVKTVVGDNFNDIVLGDKDVLVEFYAPWCGHCKRLTPVWEELGEAFSSVESIVIAKMDATANEHEHVDVSGFPSIQFFAANSKTPVDYDGSRTLDGFVAFLKNHATKNVEAVEAIANTEKKDEL